MWQGEANGWRVLMRPSPGWDAYEMHASTRPRDGKRLVINKLTPEAGFVTAEVDQWEQVDPLIIPGMLFEAIVDALTPKTKDRDAEVLVLRESLELERSRVDKVLDDER